MTHQSSVQRTAPIPIAPKPPRTEPNNNRQDTNNLRRFEIGPASLHSRGPVDSATASVSASASSTGGGASLPPCRACRFSGTRCTLGEDEDLGCTQCQISGSGCSLSSSPQSRKRKLNGESSHETSGKRRYVCICSIVPVHLQNPPPCSLCRSVHFSPFPHSLILPHSFQKHHRGASMADLQIYLQFSGRLEKEAQKP